MPDTTITLRNLAVSPIYFDKFDHITACWVGLRSAAFTPLHCPNRNARTHFLKPHTFAGEAT